MSENLTLWVEKSIYNKSIYGYRHKIIITLVKFQDKKIQEATQTVESLRKSVLELQVYLI